MSLWGPWILVNQREREREREREFRKPVYPFLIPVIVQKLYTLFFFVLFCFFLNLIILPNFCVHSFGMLHFQFCFYNGAKVLDSSSTSVQSSHSVIYNSLWPHGLQHGKQPCTLPTPGAYSNSCPSSWWFHPIISSTVVPFSSCL